MTYYVIGEKPDGEKCVLWPESPEQEAAYQALALKECDMYTKVYAVPAIDWLDTSNEHIMTKETTHRGCRLKARAKNAFVAWSKVHCLRRTGRMRMLIKEAFEAGFAQGAENERSLECQKEI